MTMTPQPRPMRSRIARALTGGWFALLAAVALSRFVAAHAWLIDLLANVSYFAAAPALLMAIPLALRRRRASAAALLVAAIAAWPIASTLWPPIPASLSLSRITATDPYVVTILVANLRGDHRAIQGLLPVLEERQPDVAAIIELGPPLLPVLTQEALVETLYPFVVGPVGGQGWQETILSRWPAHRLDFDAPPEDEQRYKFLFAFRQACFVDSPTAGRFLVAAAHPPSPRTAQTWAGGNDAVTRLCEVSTKYLLPTGAPVLLAGDFNSTPSGHRHRLMLARSDLHPCDPVGGPAGTWPADYPAPLRLSLDRVWASPGVEFLSREVLDDIGSDHRPILVTCRLRPH